MNIKNSWVATTQVFYTKMDSPKKIWLVVSTPLKNISQIGNLPQIGVKIKNIWNHQPEIEWIAPFRQPMAFWEFDSITEMFFHELRKSLPRANPNDSETKNNISGIFFVRFFRGDSFWWEMWRG